MYNGENITFTENMVVMECPKCHTLFAILKATHSRYQDKSIPRIYCPVGHPMVPGYESSVNQLEREVQRLGARIASTEDYAEQARKQRDTAKKQAAAYKGHAKQLKKRVCAGICPFCKQHFRNVERHIKVMHPSIQELL